MISGSYKITVITRNKDGYKIEKIISNKIRCLNNAIEYAKELSDVYGDSYVYELINVRYKQLFLFRDGKLKKVYNKPNIKW